MGLSLEDLCKKHGLEIATMHIDKGVSRFERDIMIPKCPNCGNYLYHYNSQHKIDPFIGAKVLVGILKEKNIKPGTWIMTCWTDDCDFYIKLAPKDMVKCPECSRQYPDTYSLYDHMKFQCTAHAKDNDVIRKAGAGEYIADLVAMEFVEEE